MNKKTFIIGSVLLGASALAWYIKSQVNLMWKLEYGIKDYKLITISKTAIKVRVNLEVKNKEAFDVKIKGYSLDVYAEGNYIANASSDKEVVLEHFKSADLPINITINPKLLYQGVKGVTQSGVIQSFDSWKDIKLKVKGNIKVSKKGIPFRVPLNYEFTLREYGY